MVRNILAQRPMGKPKVLLLGISYPSVDVQMEKHGFEKDILVHKELSVDQAVECAKRGILTEMDARDLARCVATEEVCEVEAYTVSKEIGAVYRSDRHAYGDFNGRNFCKSLRDAFGQDVQFSQVVLDYYWMPSGWLVTRWAKALFQQTLPDLVRLNMLTYPSGRDRKSKRDTLDEGVVYLPFCAHVCKELVAGIAVLEQYYAISFVKKSELDGHALWKGTMSIDGKTMQHVLGKRLDQEEIYCTFRPKDIYENMEDSHVRKPAVMRILQAIEDYDNIRMIRLKPLRQHEPPSVMKERLVEPEKGGFIGLNFNLVKDKKQQKAMEAKRKKMEAKKEEDRLRQMEEKKRNALLKKKQLQRKRKVLERRQKQAQRKAEEKKMRRRDPVCENVEIIPLEESHLFKYYFPGPAADIESYDNPEAHRVSPLPVADPSTPPPRKRGRPKSNKTTTTVFGGSKPRREYLAYNPRIAARKNQRRPAFPKSRTGSAVLDVYIPPAEYEVEGACRLLGLKERPTLEKISCDLYGRADLTCFKVPAKEFQSPKEPATRDKIKMDRWKAKITRLILREGGSPRKFVLLDRYQNMEDIYSWLRNQRHPMLDPFRTFEDLYSSLEWFGNEGIVDVAEEMEEALHNMTMTDLNISTRNAERDGLYAEICEWLRQGKDSLKNSEFGIMKSKLENMSFESDDALANEMTDRIILLRKFCADWNQPTQETDTLEISNTLPPPEAVKGQTKEVLPLLESLQHMGVSTKPEMANDTRTAVTETSSANTRSMKRKTLEMSGPVQQMEVSPKPEQVEAGLAAASEISSLNTLSMKRKTLEISEPVQQIEVPSKPVQVNETLAEGTQISSPKTRSMKRKTLQTSKPVQQIELPSNPEQVKATQTAVAKPSSPNTRSRRRHTFETREPVQQIEVPPEPETANEIRTAVAKPSSPNTRSKKRRALEISKEERDSSPTRHVAVKARQPTGRVTRNGSRRPGIVFPCERVPQTPSRERSGSSVSLSPVNDSTRSSTSSPTPPEMIGPQNGLQVPIASIQQNAARDLLHMLNAPEEATQRYRGENSSKIGPRRARLLCEILRFLEDPQQANDATGEFQCVAKLIPLGMPLMRKAYIMETVLHGLREGRGENWYALSYVPDGLGVLLSEVLQDIDSLLGIPDEAFLLKLLMGGSVHNQCVTPSPRPSLGNGCEPRLRPPTAPMRPTIAAGNGRCASASHGLYDL